MSPFREFYLRQLSDATSIGSAKDYAKAAKVELDVGKSVINLAVGLPVVWRYPQASHYSPVLPPKN